MFGDEKLRDKDQLKDVKNVLKRVIVKSDHYKFTPYLLLKIQMWVSEIILGRPSFAGTS